MTEKKFCDNCGEELKGQTHVELKIRLGRIRKIAGTVEVLEDESPYHFHRKCFTEIQEAIEQTRGE